MDYVLPKKFSNDSERCEQVSIILSSVRYRRVYIIIWKKGAMSKICCFTLGAK